MFGKNRNNKVGLWLMVGTVCLVLAALWAALATSGTALAAAPAGKGDGIQQDIPGARANVPTYHLVLNDYIAGMHVGTRDFSPSGDRIVFEHEKKLFIADKTITGIRLLLDEPPWILRYPTWSPDGRLIACTGSREGPGKQGA
ncbi:MAG: TolB-like translocation protein, partial [Planctomycetota bacterium]